MKMPAIQSILRCLPFGLLVAIPLHAAEVEKTPSTNLVTATFYITDVKCAACVSFVTESVRAVPGTINVTNFTESSGYANVQFDPGRTSHRQIALAVASTLPLHGEPFAAVLKLQIPEYAKAGYTQKVDALIARQQSAGVMIECRNRAKGTFVVRFRAPASTDKPAASPTWKPDEFLAAVKALGLEARLLQEAPISP